MNTNENLPVPGRILWSQTESLLRVKLVLSLISLVMFAVAFEAIRVATVAGISGVTPLAFGIMPTRALGGFDIAVVLAVALLGMTWVGYRLARVFAEGLPLAVSVLEAEGGEAAGLAVAWDGLMKPRRRFSFASIQEIDCIARGSLGGGGHQVRLRIEGRRIAVTIARFDTSHEAEKLVRTLIDEREAALGTNRDGAAE